MNKNNIYIGCLALALTSVSPVLAQVETEDSVVNVAFGKVAKEDLVYAVSSLNMNELSKKTANNYSLSNVSSYISGYNGNVWGQGALVLIDGVPRDASMVKASEIESVTVMKDAAAVALYGSRAAKGVVLITTRRGKVAPLSIDVRGTAGWSVPKVFPKYLDSDCYMTLYNEACANDGIAPKYDAATIYNANQGTNPYRYPSLNLYSSDYLRQSKFNVNGTADVYGGTEKTRYYLNLGVDYNNSLIKYGEHANGKDFTFNVRGNVDMTLAEWLTATTNAAVIVNDNNTGRGDYWGNAANMRVNLEGQFAPMLPISMMDTNNATIRDYIAASNHLIDGQYLLGGSTSYQSNALSEALVAGYTRQKYRKFLFDVAVKADLSGITKGLAFKTAFSVDYNTHYSEAYALGYAVYQPTWGNINGKDMIIGLNKINEDKSSTSEYVGQATYHQTMMFSAQFDYIRTFSDLHNVSANLVGWGYQQQYSADENHSGEGAYHRTSNVNLGLRAAYNYAHRYYVDFSGNVVHSAKLPEGKRNGFSPTVTLGWRISNEKFMENATWLDDLRITASYANIAQDIDISDYYMYKADYQFGPSYGWYQWADGSVGGSTASSRKGANDELTFIRRKEFRVGLDAAFLNRMFKLNLNYFNQTTSGLLTQGSSTIYPSFYNSGLGNFLPWKNFNEDRRSGFDFAARMDKKFGDWEVGIGFSGMVYTSKALTRDEVWENDYLYRQNHALDASWGYVCEGFFKDQSDIDNSPKQTFGGTVKPGDLKYSDINKDGVIDSKDQIDLGKMGWEAAPFTFGVNATVKWKNFTLFIAGGGRTGAYGYKSNAYYWNRGTSKFSEVALGRWTEATAATATYPRLTTGDGTNNYQNSTFWLYKTDNFTLNNVQLTYDLPKSIFNHIFIKGLSVYAGANDLVMLAKEREYMEMAIGSEPLYRSFYLGFKVNM
ncbi:MAG: SusC/RagA family TonB-linked outer membrane protein [Bacteroidaceae bacterium]|nr:SusC/RagA family TonB-linked outer membrane protein [Bacteroidaceae bacterium]